MKRLLIILSINLIGAFSFNATAQISKGESFLTGQLGFNVKDDRNSFLSTGEFNGTVKITTLSGSFSYQFFILPRLAIGPYFGWDYRKAIFDEVVYGNSFKFETVATGFNRQYEPGLMISYHIPISDRFNFYLTSSGRYIHIDQELQSDENTEIQDGKGYIVDLRPGIYFFVTERKKLSVRLEVGEVYFSKLYPESNPELFINEFNADFNPANFTLGAQLHFLRNKSKKKKQKQQAEELAPLFDEN